MIIAFIILMILFIYRNEEIFPNKLNLFHPENAFLALCVFSIGGSILFLLGLYRKIYRCQEESFSNFILMLFALYDIMLGISLFFMRITGIVIYLIILNVIVILFILVLNYISRYYDISKYFDKNYEHYKNNSNKKCYKISEYGDKCITYNDLENKYKYDKENDIKNEEDIEIHRLYLNLKKEKENIKKKKINDERVKYIKKCKNLDELNKDCNKMYNTSEKKYILGKYENDKCKEFNLNGHYLKSCKPYNKKDNDTKCKYNTFYTNFNKNNLLIAGEYKCNHLGMGVKNYKKCPYDKKQVYFECDPLYLNGSPIKNNKVLEFENIY